MENSERNGHGQFAKGNAGGPGRPRRTVESEYMAALSDAVPLESWKKIVARAVAGAEAGDVKARDWLSRYLLGAEPVRLFDLAIADAAGDSVDREIARLGEKAALDAVCGGAVANARRRR